MASNIQRGTRKIDAGDWVRLKRLSGGRNYLTDQPGDITNPTASVACCVTTDNNRMDRVEFGTSKVRRPASFYTDYKASQSADYVLEQNRPFGGGKMLSAVRLCNCATTDPNKHNPLCASCTHDKIEVRNNRPYTGPLPGRH
jgi:hypothetical protein